MRIIQRKTITDFRASTSSKDRRAAAIFKRQFYTLCTMDRCLGSPDDAKPGARTAQYYQFGNLYADLADGERTNRTIMKTFECFQQNGLDPT